ncbi:MAG: hypothetical protein JSS60_03310 [Verrucomicrobia bacterium]|nr:hypothetical protein [Verrucomicrobiota bacterium]
MSIKSVIPSALSFLKKSSENIEIEFKSLPHSQFISRPDADLYPEFSVGNDPINYVKNRWGNILPNNGTRVKLVGRKEDYINANHCLAGRVIISQGPLHEDSSLEATHFPHDDFYHMLWTNDCSAIAMLTDYVEKNQTKCSYYMPNLGLTKITREYKVVTTPDDSLDYAHLKELGIIVTKIIIEKNNHSKTVTHFHYPSWEDHKGTNAKVVALLARTLLKERKPLIHCSAGIGRSGTTASVMSAYDRIIKGHVPPTLVYDTVASLRAERRGSVQTLQQYQTIYDALSELVEYDTEITFKCKVPYPYTLSIRGEGAGLSWKKGEPLMQIDEETYVFRCKDYTGKVEYKVLLNDSEWETCMNHTAETGKTQESFPSLSLPKVPVVADFDAGEDRVFIRGTGPGMSWDKGIELKRVNDKYVFESLKDDAPFEFKILLNDKEWELGENHRFEPGKPLAFSPKFDCPSPPTDFQVPKKKQIFHQ